MDSGVILGQVRSVREPKASFDGFRILLLKCGKGLDLEVVVGLEGKRMERLCD